MSTLAELTLDAARYRWVRENPYGFIDLVDRNELIRYPAKVDECIDRMLERE